MVSLLLWNENLGFAYILIIKYNWLSTKGKLINVYDLNVQNNDI